MGNAGGSLHFGLDEDEEGEEDGGGHLSRVEMSSIPSAVEEDDGGLASDGGCTAECVSVTHLGRGSPTVLISTVQD